MSWEAFEEDKAFVVEALRRGEFDHVEGVGQVTETGFFRRLLGDGVLGRLAAPLNWTPCVPVPGGSRPDLPRADSSPRAGFRPVPPEAVRTPPRPPPCPVASSDTPWPVLYCLFHWLMTWQ